MQRFKNGHLPSSFDGTWLTNRIRRADQGEIELRNDDLLHVPFARTNALSRLPLVTLPKLWNEFQDENIKIIRNKIEFNSKLKQHLLTLLNDVPNCSRLLCPACHLH